MSRTPFIAGNWKMHKTVAQAEAFLNDLLPHADRLRGIDVALCAPFTALGPLAAGARGSAIEVFAQNMCEAEEGAYTGEISAPMLVELGVQGVILGHSERRELFCETDANLARKVPAALRAGLTPILAVGETLEERAQGQTESKIRRQLQADLEGVPDLEEVVIAYEPIWAIGTGNVATPDQAQEAIACARAVIAERSPDAAQAVRILYGGSVNPDNAHELLTLPDVDGALVGGASLEVSSLLAIAAAAVPA